MTSLDNQIIQTLKTGDLIKIESIKADGSLNRRWESNTILSTSKQTIVGFNKYTQVTQRDGSQGITPCPALFFFELNQYFNTVYLYQKDKSYFYCNLSSPVRLLDKTLQYIDYDLDVIVNSSTDYNLIDKDEFLENAIRYNYSTELMTTLLKQLQVLESKIRHQEAPFNTDILNQYLSFLR